MTLPEIRLEELDDERGVRAVEEAAFGRPGEADLVDALRRGCPQALSVVAVEAGQVVGHALFSPARIVGPAGELWGMGLGPVAVLPDRQCRGIGAALIRDGIARLRAAGHPFVIVLGHPGYYPRFGFGRADQWGVACEYTGVPAEAFMLLPLAPDVQIPAGTAFYRPEFREVT